MTTGSGSEKWRKAKPLGRAASAHGRASSNHSNARPMPLARTRPAWESRRSEPYLWGLAGHRLARGTVRPRRALTA
eukprot:6445192-Alexandrium_andersonii.AAC.1